MERLGWYGKLLLIGMVIACASQQAAATIRVRAVAGQPFGVGEVTFSLEDEDVRMWQCRSIRIVEPTGRLIYPVLEFPGLLQRMASRLEGDEHGAPARATFAFLFAGNQPLTFEIQGAEKRSVTVTPELNRPLKHARLARLWWKHIWGPLNERVDELGRPRPVENYLAGMGIWRMGINRHPAVRPFRLPSSSGLSMGMVKSRPDMARAVAFDHCSRGIAELPVPEAMQWTIPYAKDPEVDVKVEEIASRVPRDCFYVRFGKYSNMLWTTRLLEAKGEELLRLVTLNGFRNDANARIQSQLAIKELPMADLIGDRLISDVALIGKDMFLSDGAALGVIIRSRGKVLDQGLVAQRQEVLDKFQDAGATEEILTIAGEKVSLISTPDNRIRTFHLQDGEFHLITNCRQIVQDFVATREGNSLANLPNFRKLRELMPFEKSDTVSVYLSAEYREAVAQPARLIELMRRVRSREELTLLEVARRTVVVEQKAAVAGGLDTLLIDPDQDLVPQLQGLELLPPQFGQRSDGTTPVWEGTRFVDSHRGAIGSFLPIPDMEVTSVTEKELAAYQDFVRRHTGKSACLDPLSIRIRRRKGRTDDELEIDMRVYPIHPKSARLAGGVLGNPKFERNVVDEKALVNIQCITDGAWGGVASDARLSLTLFNGEPLPVKNPMKLLDYLDMAKHAPAYLTVQPGTHVFNQAWWRPATAVGDSQYWYGPFDLIGRRYPSHAAIAWDRQLISDLPEALAMEPTERPGQVWVHVGDLRGSTLELLVKSEAAKRAMRGSVQNVQRFHRWANLLGVDPADGSELVATLVGMEPVCPLDGSYEHQQDSCGGTWQSTAWSDQSLIADDLEGYDPALMKWWHGLDMAASLDESGLHMRTVVKVAFDMDDKSSIPKLPFFGGSMKKKKEKRKATDQ